WAPAPRANSAVRSVELLSHTINSISHPSRLKRSPAARMLPSVARMSFSSLNAGTMMEIFTGLLTMDRAPAHVPGQRCRTAGQLQKQIQIPTSKLRLHNLRFEISNLRLETLETSTADGR